MRDEEEEKDMTVCLATRFFDCGCGGVAVVLEEEMGKKTVERERGVGSLGRESIGYVY